MSNLAIREQQIKEGLIAQQRVINSLIGDKVKANKFLATASKVANDFKLANCNVNSIIDACVTVAQLNLDLSPALSHAYLVPYGSRVNLEVTARGYTALLARTGWKVKAYSVNYEDEFEYSIDGFDETIKFKKNLDNENESFRYAVALAKSPDGTIYMEIMNTKQIDKHRKASSNQKGEKPTGVWADWYEEMARKTVIKKLIKKLPLGEEIANVVDADDKPIEAQIVDSEPLKETPKELNLNELMMTKKTPHTDAESDMLEDIEIEISQEEINYQTGEVKKTKKPDTSILDRFGSNGMTAEEMGDV